MEWDADTEKQIIISIGMPASLISLLSTSFVFGLYCCFPQLQSFTFRLVAYIQMADFMMSLGQFLNIFMMNQTKEALDENFLCQLQAYFCQYGALSTMIWAIIITTMMYLSMSRGLKILESYENTVVFIGFHIPGMISIIPFFVHGYGSSGAFCWIKANQSQKKMYLLMIMVYYIFLWFAMVYNSFLMFCIHKKLKRLKVLNNHTFYDKIKYFPLVLTIWWTIPTIHRLYQMIYGKDNFLLAAIHVFCESSYGFVNMILYALNPKVRSIIRNKFRSLCQNNGPNINLDEDTRETIAR